MSNKNQADTAKMAKAAPSPLQVRLESYASLEKKVKQRSNLQIHYDKIEELNIKKPLNEFEESDSNPSIEKIVIHADNERYEIKNPVLAEIVCTHLKATIQNRMKDLETEILAATI